MHSAIIYDTPDPRGHHGIDIVDLDNEIYNWHIVDEPLSPRLADEALKKLGWRRVSEWEREEAIVDCGPGWTTLVEPVTGDPR